MAVIGINKNELRRLLNTQVYTLDTWEANGAETHIRTNVATEIFDIRYVIARVIAGTPT